jgi:lysozyme family protein
MPDKYFTLAMVFVFGAEGAPSDDPVNDPNGGLTRFGISQTQNPDIDVASLTQEQAIEWYRTRRWLANSCDEMPWPVNLAVFDAEINQGPATGNRFLQEALRVGADGVIGPQTLKALSGAGDILDLTARIIAKRAVSYTHDSEWPMDGEGWMYRLAKLGLYAGAPTG